MKRRNLLAGLFSLPFSNILPAAAPVALKPNPVTIHTNIQLLAFQVQWELDHDIISTLVRMAGKTPKPFRSPRAGIDYVIAEDFQLATPGEFVSGMDLIEHDDFPV